MIRQIKSDTSGNHIPPEEHMEKILITGFDPFGGQSINPAWEAVKALSESICGIPLHKVRVPTVFGRCAEILEKAAASLEAAPLMILMIGQAGGRACVTPEMAALNIRCAAIPDNEGNAPRGTAVLDGGENAIFCSLPLLEIADTLKAEGLPVAVSFHAGTFVCNDLYYAALHRYGKEDIPCCFIHVPFLPGQAEGKAPSLPLPVIVNTLERLIRAFLKALNRAET